jgi:hypothetical protein
VPCGEGGEAVFHGASPRARCKTDGDGMIAL